MAGGDYNGVIKFLLDPRSNLSRILTNDHITKPSDNIVDVPIKKIDSFLQEKQLNQLDFIRMDVEGYESNIYEGMRNSIKKFRPMIQMEIHAHLLGKEKTKNFLERIREDGYEVIYYIIRQLDLPTVGDMNDVKKLKILDLLNLLNQNKLPTVFLVFLKPIN